ncbi:hypothetical protein [Plastoroseomonas arctica]|uniref:Uncharacterized protein n=1 Tax=Plastoroseomonas arctica TaxID=1509237 RepID=A0AAF1K7D3_9PROT|nr:hypothetical protein [Plastoroseomonas arctica]MBR0657006.1 hypothetical protein [Plastoroseomonas arctica]
MANEVDFAEILITPAATMIREIGASVAAAQQALDQGSIAAQAALRAQAPELEAAGYQVTWYQIPEAQVEMKVAVHFEKKTTDAPLRMYLTPFNAKYRTGLDFAAEGTSTLKLRIVPVPPVTRPE